MHRLTRLCEAFDYAAQAHRYQSRKGTNIPYLSHVMGVSALVLEHGGDEDQAIGGLLHDVLEDCGAHHEATIRSAFGERVATIVLTCTDGVPDNAGAKAPWRERKEAYIRHLRTAPADAVIVSACDKLHNARAIATDLSAGQPVFERFTGGRDGTVWYYRSLAELFRQRLGSHHPVALELDEAVGRLTAGPGAQAGSERGDFLSR